MELCMVMCCSDGVLLCCCTQVAIPERPTGSSQVQNAKARFIFSALFSQTGDLVHLMQHSREESLIIIWGWHYTGKNRKLGSFGVKGDGLAYKAQLHCHSQRLNTNLSEHSCFVFIWRKDCCGPIFLGPLQKYLTELKYLQNMTV